MVLPGLPKIHFSVGGFFLRKTSEISFILLCPNVPTVVNFHQIVTVETANSKKPPKINLEFSLNN